MSSDFRPIEMYMLSKESDPDFLFLNAVWNVQGKEVRMYDNKQKNIILSYEYLGRCSPSLTLKLHKFFEKHDRLDVMKTIENDVRNYIENNDQNINEDIKKWLRGEHDPAFYYREKNDEVFVEKMEDKYKCKIISINELKGLYESLNAADIADRSELIDAINNNDIYKLFKIDNVGKDEYEMTNEDKDYTLSWSKTYPVNMMIEDVVRAMQVLSDIEIEGVYNTPSLISKIKETEEINRSNLDERIKMSENKKQNNLHGEHAIKSTNKYNHER